MTCVQIALAAERPWYGWDWSDPLDGRGDYLQRPIAFPKHPVAAILVGLLPQLSGRHCVVGVLLRIVG